MSDLETLEKELQTAKEHRLKLLLLERKILEVHNAIEERKTLLIRYDLYMQGKKRYGHEDRIDFDQMDPPTYYELEWLKQQEMKDDK